jgi:hypothetical protein
MGRNRKPQPTRSQRMRGRLGEKLSEYDQLRVSQAKAMDKFPGLSEGFGELLRWCDALRTAAGLDPEMHHLLDLIEEKTGLGVLEVLSQPDPRDGEHARFLLELQLLLEDFVAEPSGLQVWASLPAHERHSRYSFGQLRQRAEARQGIPPGMVSPHRDDYRAHSLHSHPYPARDRLLALERGWDALFDLGDLFSHVGNTLSAADEAVRLYADGYPSATDEVDWQLVADIMQRVNTAGTGQLTDEERAEFRAPRPTKSAPPRRGFVDPRTPTDPEAA